MPTIVFGPWTFDYSLTDKGNLGLTVQRLGEEKENNEHVDIIVDFKNLEVFHTIPHQGQQEEK